MFSHRGLFLAVTISLASIALARVLVQPGYQHQYDSNPRYSASTEPSKSEIIAHDDDVAAKSSLTDAKHSTTIDSLLPADTTDKSLEICQAVTNDLISIRLPDTFKYLKYFNTEDSLKRIKQSSSTDAKPPHFNYSLFPESEFPESKRTDTTDKRLAFCRGVNEFFIAGIQLKLKSLNDMSSKYQTLKSRNMIKSGITIFV